MALKDNKRALQVIRTLRAKQNKQSEQIEILCQDMVSAHRDFSTKLAKLNLVVSFYESLLKCKDMQELLNAAVKGIRQTIQEADAALFLLSESGFDVHIADAGVAESVEKRQFHHWFSLELVNNISQMNRVCSLDQLLRMGLQGPPAIIKTVSIAAIPLGRLGRAVGFVLVYRPAHLPLRSEELSRMAAISNGLREAILSFQQVRTKPSKNSLHV